LVYGLQEHQRPKLNTPERKGEFTHDRNSDKNHKMNAKNDNGRDFDTYCFESKHREATEPKGVSINTKCTNTPDINRLPSHDSIKGIPINTRGARTPLDYSDGLSTRLQDLDSGQNHLHNAQQDASAPDNNNKPKRPVLQRISSIVK
jgi:hypothetical protein